MSPSARISSGNEPVSSTRSILTWSSRRPCTRSSIDQRTLTHSERAPGSDRDTTAESVSTRLPPVNSSGRPLSSVEKAAAARAGTAPPYPVPARAVITSPIRSACRHPPTTPPQLARVHPQR